MEENSHIDPEAITTKHVDIQKVLASKNVKLPKWMVRWVERLLHVEEINYVIYNHRYKFGLDFVHAFLEGTEPHDLNVKVEVVNPECLPREGYPIIAGNHPLGGPDGLALMGAIGRYRQDIKFPVNDFLLYLPGPAPLFVPIDKVHRNTSNVGALEAAFAGQNALLYFPAGLCSRKRKGGEIHDLEWKPTFIKKAVRYQRDVVTFFFDARNRERFYNLARLRERLGIRFNFEMALLPAEMFAQRGKTLRLVVGKPIPYATFDSRHSAKEWAQMVQDYCYTLKDNPAAVFEATMAGKMV
ncbi:MAG: glycerol acyltransferase [Bacteroidales bacterium]|nr:glycerol acyltransferase [Bacteroidales bacterium]